MPVSRLADLTEDDHLGNPDWFDEDDRKLHKKYLQIGVSSIPGAGVGVYAKRAIKKDTCIGCMIGEVTGTVDRFVTMTETDEGTLLRKEYGPLSFVNHSKDPNVYFDHGDDYAWGYALRDIAKGEELFWDYAVGSDSDEDLLFTDEDYTTQPDVRDLHPHSVVAWLQERDLWGNVVALTDWLAYEQNRRSPHMPTRHDPSYADEGRALKTLINQLSFSERGENEEPVTLKSGRKSRVYFNLRPTLLNTYGLDLATIGVTQVLDDLEEEEGIEYDAVCGVLDGGASLATSVGLHYWQNHNSSVPILMVRKETKEHGLGGLVMGTENTPKGSRIIVLEDVATTGSSALRAAVALREAGLVVEHCICVVDREEGAQEALKREGIQLHALHRKSAFTELK